MLGHGRSEMRWREEDLDEYEDEEERYGEEGEEDEEEEEEEEEHKPTQEELEYLRIREKLKDKVRLKVQKENAALLGRSGGSGDRKRPLSNAEFGSFFGPSKPVIARRVIEERHSLQETQHMRARESSSNHVEKREHISTNGEKRIPIISNGQAKTNAYADRLKAVTEIRSKAQALKDMRDYSFLLSDDADLPAPTREPPPRKPSVSHSDARPTQAPPRTKVEMNKHAVTASEDSVLKKPTSIGQKIPQKVGPLKVPPMSRPKPSSSVPKHISNVIVGNGPSRLQNGKTGPASSHQNLSMKKPSASSTNKPASLESVVKPSLSSQRHNLERRKEIQVPSKEKVVAKQPMSSSRTQQQISSTQPKYQQIMSSSKLKPPMHSSKPQPQLSKAKPSKPIVQQRPQQKPPKRKPVSRYSDDDEEGESAINMIRQMFRYNPNKYAGVDEDDSDMEANFDEILREEKRSSIIAKREDEEQLRLIEEEEERERIRMRAKKRKLG